MSILINDQQLAEELLAERRLNGGDRFDEVWDGVYVMSPITNNEHQSFATQLSIAIGTQIDWRGLGRTFTGANVSDRREVWRSNYRIPDVLVYLNANTAEDCGTHWSGGPDLAIEITSPGDRTLEKLNFCANVGTQELLVIDRHPWHLTLYRLHDDSSVGGRALVPIAVAGPEQYGVLQSNSLAIRFELDLDASVIRLIRSDETILREIPIRT